MGYFFACKIMRVVGLASPLNAELVGIREVLSWIKDQEWQKVKVEVDNVQAIRAVTSPGYSGLIATEGVVLDCKFLLNRISCDVRFHHVSRSTNEFADNLTQAIRSSSSLGE